MAPNTVEQSQGKDLFQTCVFQRLVPHTAGSKVSSIARSKVDVDTSETFVQLRNFTHIRPDLTNIRHFHFLLETSENPFEIFQHSKGEGLLNP